MTPLSPTICRCLRWLQALYLVVAVLLVQMLLVISAMATDPITSAAEIDYPPFSIVTGDGSVEGFSVELLRAALKAMGRDVTFRTGTWPHKHTDSIILKTAFRSTKNAKRHVKLDPYRRTAFTKQVIQ